MVALQNHGTMNSPINVGVVGLGRSGWGIHALTIENHPHFRVVAVVDPEAERRDEAVARFGCAAYTDTNALLSDEQVELVVVATPSHTHAEISCAALRQGKHVLVEKPMATCLAEADAMIEAATQNDQLLMVFQILRLDSVFLKIQEVLRSGVLGPIHLIRRGLYDYQRRRDWQTLIRYGGGQLNNSGAHLLDQALLLAGGQWHDLRVDLRRITSAGDADDHTKIVFTGGNGILFDVELSNACAAALPEWIIMGQYGTLVCTRRHLTLKYYDPAALPPRQVDEGPAANRSYGAGEEIPWIEETLDIAYHDATPLFYDHLYRTLRQGAPPLVPIESSYQLMGLLDACRAAIAGK